MFQILHTYTDAINSPEHTHWRNATNKEMGSPMKHRVYELVPTASVLKDN